jgi:hypothetical protein
MRRFRPRPLGHRPRHGRGRAGLHSPDPLLLLASALAPASGRDLVSSAIIGKFGLEGSAADAVQQLFANSGQGSVGVLSVVLLVFSASRSPAGCSACTCRPGGWRRALA